MKKLIAVLLVALLCLAAANAAEWGEGLGPAKPLPGLREVDLTKTLGYFYRFPYEKLPVYNFCDVLELYIPREDVALGEGHLHLYDAEGEVADLDFTNPDHVELRNLEESELVSLAWGGGVCVTMHLPISLAIGGEYYVLMDEGCLTAADGAVKSLPMTQPEQWVPVLYGDYGVSSLRYTAAPAEGDEAQAPAEYKYHPEAGDIVTFDVVIGGDIKTAICYSENDSVYFDVWEFTESCTVVGQIRSDEVDWGVVFLDADNNVVRNLRLRQYNAEEAEAAETAEEVPAE